ncbi:MAG: UDP-2,3-diacylglucosamine diphosphatase [Gammaproteobacteria bacterium]|nr:UDP-2,3-diacylglucosamine diphosphatase [Gammaproteobacteria bacterium]MBV9724576.1 UDP-2,3-diacylglucosamine diphosphatase [Gammaproteobacteria bacterium]
MARLFVSDVHLDAAAPQATEQFLSFLREQAAAAEALYILGDLFEAWVGDDDEEPGNERVCRALRELTSGGVACFALHGNRDFLLGAGFCARSGCRVLSDPVITQLDGERVLLTHGDALCTDDHPYQELRSMVRDRTWQQRFLALPRAHREQLADEARQGSRRHIARTVPDIMDVNGAAVAAAFRAARVQRIVHGHTHRPGVHRLEIDGTARERIVLGAWYEQGSYLRYERGRYQLCTLPRH